MSCGLQLFAFKQHEEQLRAKQAEVAAAQEKLALQSGREESFKKMLADAQEAQSKLMGMKAKLQATQTSNEATIAEQRVIQGCIKSRCQFQSPTHIPSA